MVGEIRDKETAQLSGAGCFNRALSIFYTCTLTSAAGILPRLLDMGIEPFLIASTVRTVIGQRLVRRIDGEPEAYDANTVETDAIKSYYWQLIAKNRRREKADNRRFWLWRLAT